MVCVQMTSLEGFLENFHETGQVVHPETIQLLDNLHLLFVLSKAETVLR